MIEKNKGILNFESVCDAEALGRGGDLIKRGKAGEEGETWLGNDE